MYRKQSVARGECCLETPRKSNRAFARLFALRFATRIAAMRQKENTLMSATFVRIPTLATKDVAKRNLRLAKERYNRAKEMSLTGVSLHCYVIGLQGKDGAESNRSLIVYSLLVSGVGSYALSDIAATCDIRHKDGSALTLDGKVRAIRTALQSYIVPRARECAPFFPFDFIYNKAESTVRVVAVAGAAQARDEMLAPRTRVKAEAKPLSLPSPQSDVA